MNIGEIAEATRGRIVAPGCDLVAAAEAGFAGIATDTRSLNPGEMFVAIRGENFDGNDFLEKALACGAVALVCHEGRALDRDGVICIEVDNTETALGDIAHAYLGKFAVPIVGITGSNGKTTTKELLRSILAQDVGWDSVLANQGNFNNLIGLPLTAMKLRDHHRYAVLEMGMNAPGEIARLAEIADPDVGVITCVAGAHLEGVGSIEGVAEAKGELFAGLRSDATAVYNADDFRVAALAERFNGRKIGFGMENGDVRAVDIEAVGLTAMRFGLVIDGRSQPVELPLPGAHNISNALAATAAALALGIDRELVPAGLASVMPPPMRLIVEPLANGVELVNDSYNANPASLKAALATVGSGAPGGRILVLGDMLELGDESADLHREAGLAAALIEPSLLCALGEFAEFFVEGALEGGMTPENAVVAADHEDAAARVARVWSPGDTILLKGSRGAHIERVGELLRGLSAQ